MEDLLFEQKELKPQESVEISYRLTPLKMGSINPSRANISYSVGNDFEDDDDITLKTGISSNWISTRDEMLMLNIINGVNNDNLIFGNNLINNMNNNKIIILSSSMYSRSISSTIIYWILFILFCLTSIIYPLCEYETNKGDFSFIPFEMGHYVKIITKLVNFYIVNKIRQQIGQINKGKIAK